MRLPLFTLLTLCLTACEACPPGPTDGGESASTSSSSGGSSSGGASSGSGGVGDGGVTGDGGGADAGSGCGPNTEGFGEPCGDCGAMLCDPQTGELACMDPGKNECGGCGSVNKDGGIVGRTCGSCGIVACNDGGTATECTGEHPPNECGGCEDFPDGRGPPDAGCSECNTGVWRCQVSLNDLSCWGGRGQDSSCGCEPCVKLTAEMADLSQGAFILSGTRAVIEDVGADDDMGTIPGQTHILTFDPLILGPGGAAMEGALVYISPSERHDDTNAFALFEYFSAYSAGEPGDPVRQYHIDQPLDGMRYVIIYENFLDRVVSRGELIPAPVP